MSAIDDLAEFAELLRQRGIDAWHEIIYGPRGYLEGLDVGEDFFPLWELNLPENQEAVEALDFATVKARRGATWSVAPPAHAGS